MIGLTRPVTVPGANASQRSIATGWRLISLLVIMASGCEVREPLSKLVGCIGAASRSLGNVGDSITARCDVGADVLLIALPERRVSSSELQAAHVAGDLAPLLDKDSSISGPRWCTVESHNADAPLPRQSQTVLKGSGHCTENSLQVSTVLAAEGRVFELRISKVSEGMRLDGVTLAK